MTIRLTPEQERRLRAVLDRGAYKSVEEVVEAALTAVEQRTVPGFAGTPEELDSLLAEGVTRELPISTCARGYITLLHELCRTCDGPDQVFGGDRALSQRSLA
jgi:Arc/MetJ-type ribon-helix-helix transcriptional regulator